MMSCNLVSEISITFSWPFELPAFHQLTVAATIGIGFVQYLAPSCALLLAVFLYDELVPQVRWVTFAFIWSALAIFTAENVYNLRKRPRIAQERTL